MEIPFLDEAENRGILKGESLKAEKIALNMLRKGLSFDQIQEFTELTLEKIKELAKNNLTH